MTPRLRALQWATALLAAACAATQTWAHPAIKRWNYEATVISLGSENLVDLRVGDPIRGSLGFDSTADNYFGFYFNADDFANITAIVENPRTGDEAAYRDVVGIGVGIYDEMKDGMGRDRSMTSSSCIRECGRPWNGWKMTSRSCSK